MFYYYLEFVLFSVDDDRGDLLVHEQQDCEEQRRHQGQKVDVPTEAVVEEGHQPSSKIGSRRL